jgi:hypothetical protein
MAKGLAAVAFLALLILLALSAACDGGGGDGGLDVDIKDFDTARFTMTQTSTSGEESSQLSGQGVIDNRKQALSVTYEGGPGGQIVAIGRTIYTLSEGADQWTSVEEPVDGQVGFGRPYWPKFWLDAVQIEELGGQSLQGGETSGYRLPFDLEEVGKRLQAPEATEPLDVRQAEVEVWVDQDTRYAVQLTFRLELAFGANSTKLEITSNFSDFGTDVQIEAPEAASPTPGPTEPLPTGATATPAPGGP